MPEIHLPKTYLEWSTATLVAGKTGFHFHLSLTIIKNCFCNTGSNLAKFVVNKLAFFQLSIFNAIRTLWHN
jgi:hypothetical protein